MEYNSKIFDSLLPDLPLRVEKYSAYLVDCWLNSRDPMRAGQDSIVACYCYRTRMNLSSQQLQFLAIMYGSVREYLRLIVFNTGEKLDVN